MGAQNIYDFKFPLAEDVSIPPSQMRQVIKRRMMESLSTTAQFTLISETDVTGMTGIYDHCKNRFKATYTDILIKAVAVTLKTYPVLNSTITGSGSSEEKLLYKSGVHIGVATALASGKEGLLVPVISNADTKSLAEIAAETKELIPRARLGKLTFDEMSGGTFTISNLGTLGIDGFTPVINLPESAILGIGRIKEVYARAGEKEFWQKVMVLSLTVDHRIIDGYVGAEFLKALSDLLSSGEALLSALDIN